MRHPLALGALAALSTVVLAGQAAKPPARPAPARPTPAQVRLDALKKGVALDVEGMRVMTQQMTDQVFSFAELGYQEVETSKYLTGVLEKDGFTVERGVAGMTPTTV